MPAKFAILGATGAVGIEFLDILLQRGVCAADLKLLASPRSAGRAVRYGDDELVVEAVSQGVFEGCDVALFSAGASVSREWASVANAEGARVVDNSSAFRMDPEVPLVIPEINSETIGDAPVIANPNCSTIIMNMVVWPLHRASPVERIVVSTYQAVSGAGQQAMLELEAQTRDVLDGREAVPSVLPVRSAFNLFSHNSTIGKEGYNGEEMKMVHETRKIFGTPDLAITATCVRVPVLRAHSEAINLTFKSAMNAETVRDLLASAPGVSLVDDREKNHFPMPVDASGIDPCLVGRIRQDISQPDGRGIELFVCGDQLRKGAALNAIQIADHLLGQGQVGVGGNR